MSKTTDVVKVVNFAANNGTVEEEEDESLAAYEMASLGDDVQNLLELKSETS